MAVLKKNGVLLDAWIDRAICCFCKDRGWEYYETLNTVLAAGFHTIGYEEEDFEQESFEEKPLLNIIESIFQQLGWDCD